MDGSRRPQSLLNRRMIVRLLGLSAIFALSMSLPAPSPIVGAEFVFETAPFASAHASTIVETRDGLVTAWFGGTREGAPDVGIWLSRRVKDAWTAPVEVANGVQTDGSRHPCWNPVLFYGKDRTLTLFYKVGPSPQTWWGMARTSRDEGKTWSEGRRLPDGILGPIKNKPVRLADGTPARRQQHRIPRTSQRVARALRAIERCRPDLDDCGPCRGRGRYSDRRDPAEHPDCIPGGSSRPSGVRDPGRSSRPGRATADAPGRRLR